MPVEGGEMVNCAPGATAPRHQPVVIETGELPSICQACESRPVSVCSAIDDHDLHRLAAAATVIEIAPGKTFINEGDPAEFFYNLTLGTVKLYKLLPDGRRQITGFAHRGDFLGLAVSQSYAFSAEAVEPVRFCRFSRNTLRGVLDEFPALEKRLLDFASNELVAAQEQMLLLGRKTARERVASFLLSQEARTAPCRHEAPAVMILAMTRSDIADYLGLTIETVSRTFTRLKNEGMIGIPTTDKVQLLDREGLAELAEGYGD
jgi:CRP/FNR family transcriptional regulator